MPRVKTIIGGDRRSAIVDERVTETYTLRQDLPDGKVIRYDDGGLWLHPGGWSAYGVPPQGWDASKAVPDYFTRSWTEEGVDYS